jgi:hypothetical protein
MSAKGIKLESVLKIACKQLATGSERKKSRCSKLPLTERQKELNVRSGGGEIFLDWLRSLPSNESNAAYFIKWMEDYDMARFGKLRKSKKKRAAFQFLSLWRNALIYDQEAARAGQPVKHTRISIPLRLGFLSPFVRALNSLDAEFFRGLAEAMRILNEERISFNKNHSDVTLDQWLLEYKMRIWPKSQHTVRELNEQLVSKLRITSDKKLRERCRKLGVPINPDARGARATRYKNPSNGTPIPRKKD